MTDTMTPEQRSRCMAAIKGKDTKPEMIVRRYLFSRGLRFRVQVRKLPGNPDIVLPKYKTVIFVNGCFWHGHEGCKHFRLPKSNVDFWKNKIDNNIARDIRTEAELKSLGWRVLRVWECEIRAVSTRDGRLQSLYDTILHPEPACRPAAELAPAPYTSSFESLELPSAAEPESRYGQDLSND